MSDHRSEQEFQVVAERLAPRTSIKFFALLIGVSSVAMLVFRQAFVDDQIWAKSIALLILISLVCFLAYFLVFIVANAFSWITDSLIRKPTSAVMAGLPSDQASEPQDTTSPEDSTSERHNSPFNEPHEGDS